MGIGDILGGKAGETANIFLYNVLGQVVSAILLPYITAIEQEQLSLNPDVALNPGQLATAVLRGYMAEADGAAEAAKSGLDAAKFGIYWRSNGLPIAPQQAAEALRRGFLPEDSGDPNTPGYLQAIREGDLRDIWADVVKQLATSLPSPLDAVAADVQSQLDSATAREYYIKFGGDPAYYDMLYNVAGAPISAGEAGTLANRGVIPWKGRGAGTVSFEQAIYEGHQKDKWEPYLAKLQEYLPPPRTITAMQKAGTFTDAQATTLYLHYGMTPEMAASYTANAHAEKVAGTKDLAESTIRALYDDQLMDAATATQLLGILGYSPDDAAFILAVEDTRLQQGMLHSAITRLQTLYIARKVHENDVLAALAQLGVKSTQVNNLLSLWKLERANNIKILTQAEVVDAWAYQVLSESEAMAELEGIGYTAFDAWVLLSNKNKGPLPNKPAQTPTPIELGPTLGG